MTLDSTSTQDLHARPALRDARFSDWQLSEGHMLTRPGGSLEGRLRLPYKARRATAHCLWLTVCLGHLHAICQSPDICLPCELRGAVPGTRSMICRRST